MDLGTVFAALALVMASAGVLFYAIDRRDVRETFRQLKGFLGSLSPTASDPEILGAAMGHAMRLFFSGIPTIDDDGNEVIQRHDQAAFQFSQGLVATMTQVAMPMFMEELPILLASSRSSKVAHELAERSAMARGVAKLPDGLGGLQSLQKAMGMLPGGKGAGAIKWIENLQGLIGAYQEIKSSGLLDMLAESGNGQSTSTMPTGPGKPPSSGGVVVNF